MCCRCLGYCCAYIGLAIRVASFLALGTIVYFVFGTIGLFVTEFSDVDWQGNHTSRVLSQRAWVMVADAWRRWSFPEPFLRWGWIAVGIYTVLVIGYAIVHCHMIARQCSDRVARIGTDKEQEDRYDDERDYPLRPIAAEREQHRGQRGLRIQLRDGSAVDLDSVM
jgi:hypothetical protein